MRNTKGKGNASLSPGALGKSKEKMKLQDGLGRSADIKVRRRERAFVAEGAPWAKTGRVKGAMDGECGEGLGGRTRQRVASMWSQAGVAADCERPGGFAETVQSREAL